MTPRRGCPPRKAVRCAYVARQVAVKHRYGLSVTAAERDAMVRVLTTCPGQAAAPLRTGDRESGNPAAVERRCDLAD